MDDCIFCKIIKGEVPAHKVYEDDHVIAFLDIMPRSKGHTMVIPKTHAPTILDLPDGDVGPMLLAVKKVTGMINAALEPDGFTMGVNQGDISGQTVKHLHFHIMPRWHGDGGGSVHSVVNKPGEESVEDLAERIRGQK